MSDKSEPRWLACIREGARHVIPLHDERKHEGSVTCWCKPTPEIGPVNSVVIWVHHETEDS